MAGAPNLIANVRGVGYRLGAGPVVSAPARRRGAVRQRPCGVAAPLRRRNGLRRKARLERRTGLTRVTPLPRSRVSPASELQRQKVAGRPCLVCGRRPVNRDQRRGDPRRHELVVPRGVRPLVQTHRPLAGLAGVVPGLLAR
jgi:hypothetical protein